jgi:uncharacterized membrane protein YraQ (UPF0718 family)
MKEALKKYLVPAVFLVAIAVSFLVDFAPGKAVFSHFTDYFIEMMAFIPFLFIIIGLFDVWFPREMVQRHIGEESGLRGMLLVVILAMFQAGPLYAAFPVAAVLHKKGASVRNIFVYLGAFSTLKIPMLGMEIGFLGPKFTLARTLVSLPLFIGIAYLMEWYLKNKDFHINEA